MDHAGRHSRWDGTTSTASRPTGPIGRAAFAPSSTWPWSAPASFVTIEVEADGFLYNMVRSIAGTLMLVGAGKRPEAWVADVLAAENRVEAGPTAPATGLVSGQGPL